VELFELALGRGAGPTSSALAPARRHAVERHLVSPPDVAAWVADLVRRPPAALRSSGSHSSDADIRLAAAERPSSAHHAADQPRHRSLSRWLPLAAAVLVLALGVAVVQGNRAQLTFPSVATLRGALAEPLHFPRGRVLGAKEASVGLFATEPRYEFRAMPGADGYRLELRRHSGSAFDAGVVEWSTTTKATDIAGPPLAEGHYSWEVFGTADGLERSLGTQTFNVVNDAPALAQLSKASLEGQVRSLVAAGLVTDARHRARMLPASPERDRFLGSVPAR
jgi:hypothetical protein